MEITSNPSYPASSPASLSPARLSPIQGNALDAMGAAQATTDRAVARAVSGNLEAGDVLTISSAEQTAELAARLIQTESAMHKRLLDITV